MSSLPCQNPACSSHGAPHPNCKCYAAMAEGGMVDGHFCDSHREHEQDCQYYAEGGPVSLEGGIEADQLPSLPAGAQVDLQGAIPDDQFVSDEDRYGSPVELAKTAAEGVGRGLAGPVFTAAETGLLGNANEQRAREEANPLTAGASELGGFGAGMLAGTGEAAVLESAGKAAANLVENKIGQAALKGATEWGLLQAGNEASKMIRQDPGASVQNAIMDVGLAAALGTGVGGALGGIGLLVDKNAPKIAQELENFKGRMAERTGQTIDPTEAVHDELTSHYGNMLDLADETYGPSGIKSTEIAKAVPEMHEGILNQAEGFKTKLAETIDKMAQKPGTYPARFPDKLQGFLDEYSQNLEQAGDQPSKIFNAIQDLKQQIQKEAKLDKVTKSTAEDAGFIKQMGSLQNELRTGLEDHNVWGKAAKLQQDINSAYSKMLPNVKQFEKYFTKEIRPGERIVDVGLVDSFMNKLGKSNNNLKEQVLKNYIDSSKTFKNTIDGIHREAGIESPIKFGSLNAVEKTFTKPTLGAKLADSFLNSVGSITEGGLGAGIGGIAGKHIGGELGAIVGAMIGKEALHKPIEAAFHGILEPILKSKAVSGSFNAAMDYALSVIKGNELTEKAAANIFKEGADVLPSSKLPTEAQRNKLIKTLSYLKNNPAALAGQAGSAIGHYLPDHSTAAGATLNNAASILNNQKPQNDPKAPLDNKLPTSAFQKRDYQKMLDLAQQPLLLLDKAKKGTISSKDVQMVQQIYPDAYKTMSQKVMNQMIEAKSKGKHIPYHTQVGLSILLGQPLSSTMTPMSILAAQPKDAQPQQQQTQGPNGGRPVSSTKLNKLPGEFQTAEQSRMQRMQKS